MSKKILIVGHGLAGAILTHTLLERGEDVLVVDSRKPHSASHVSAGLINPFIGPKLNLPGDFADSMDANLKFLRSVNSQTGPQFLRSIDLIRVFRSDEQRANWNNLPGIYKKSTLDEGQCMKLKITAPNGAGITKAWKFDSEGFLKFSEEILSAQNRLICAAFQSDSWPDYQVIFCEGFRVIENQWFKNLPFSPAQGEVLSVRSTSLLHASNGTWYTSDQNLGVAKAGSTWKHHDLESGPTLSAKNEILRNLDFIPCTLDNLVTAQSSGVRNGTRDRNPIMGRHPEFKNYYVFNGFGSRGCTTIALCAREFTDFLLNETPLPGNKDMKRFN